MNIFHFKNLRIAEMILGIILCFVACTSAFSASGKTIGMRYLAADPALRAEMHDTRLVVGQAVYVGPLVKLSNTNWEKDWYFRNHGMVSYDPKVYPGQYPKLPWRWWYILKSKIDGSNIWPYAESSDGIHWKKPIINPKGDSHTPEPNNIAQHGTGYLNPNPNAPASERYLRVYREANVPGFLSLYVQTSPDGINLSPPITVFRESEATVYGLDGGNQIYWDAVEKKYVLTVRLWYDKSGNPTTSAGSNGYRGGATRRSETLAGLINAPLEYNIKPNELYGPITDNCDDIYMTNIVAYHGQFIATPNIYHAPRNNHDDSGGPINAPSGSVYPQFLYSRDSKTWHADPETKEASLVNLAHHNVNFKADGDMLFAEAIVEQGKKLWFFYSYRDFPHNEFNNENEKTRSMTTHIAQMRIDGFMAIANTPKKIGIWVTSPLTVPANAKLNLNTVVNKGGSVKVEVLDANNSPIPGYSAKDVVPRKQGNYLAANVAWRKKQSLESIIGRTVKLRFSLSNASIYSFEFVKAK